MSLRKEIEDFVIRIRGGSFFLSPRERMFLDLLNEMGVPPSVVKEGLEICISAVNPSKRQKFPIFLCLGKILELYENYQRIKLQREPFDWKERYLKKINAVMHLLDSEPPSPRSEEDAQKVLKELEKRIFKKLWESLEQEEKRKILDSVREFRREDDIYRELIKKRVFDLHGIPRLSLYLG